MISRKIYQLCVISSLILMTAMLTAGQNVGTKEMDERTDKELVECLVSNENGIAKAIFLRGERMIPLLMKLKGERGQFVGEVLGSPNAAQLTLISVVGNEIADKGQLVTTEVVALYLIKAIYLKKITFAQSAYLTDLALPPEKRDAYNSELLINRAWKSVETWNTKLKSMGIDTLREKKIDPLTEGKVNFW